MCARFLRIVVRILQTYLNHVSAGERLARLLEDASQGGRVPRARPLPVPAKQKTAAQVEEMVGLWHQCRNVEEVARLVGADQTTVRRNPRKVGIDTSPRRMIDADIQEIGRSAASFQERGPDGLEITNEVELPWLCGADDQLVPRPSTRNLRCPTGVTHNRCRRGSCSEKRRDVRVPDDRRVRGAQVVRTDRSCRRWDAWPAPPQPVAR